MRAASPTVVLSSTLPSIVCPLEPCPCLPPLPTVVITVCECPTALSLKARSLKLNGYSIALAIVTFTSYRVGIETALRPTRTGFGADSCKSLFGLHNISAELTISYQSKQEPCSWATDHKVNKRYSKQVFTSKTAVTYSAGSPHKQTH